MNKRTEQLDASLSVRAQLTGEIHMRTIKFRYRLNFGGKIETHILTIQQIESGFFKNLGLVKVESRDQYTGLKDKNGKEIYEGDILKAKLDSGEFTNVKVWYMAPEWMLAEYSDEKPKGSYSMHLWGYGIDMPDLEIIGNIYKNKDLLEENG